MPKGRGYAPIPYYYYRVHDVSDNIILSTCPLHTTIGEVKERKEHIGWSIVMPRQHPFVTGTTLRTTGLAPADSRL